MLHKKIDKKIQNMLNLYGVFIKSCYSYQKRKEMGNVEKLVTSFEDKEKYVIHISALKLALNHGLKLRKPHTVIEFKQEAWLKPYIEMNTKLRTEAKNDFEKDFFKLMNNSVFGKTKKKKCKKLQRY